MARQQGNRPTAQANTTEHDTAAAGYTILSGYYVISPSQSGRLSTSNELGIDTTLPSEANDPRQRQRGRGRAGTTTERGGEAEGQADTSRIHALPDRHHHQHHPSRT